MLGAALLLRPHELLRADLRLDFAAQRPRWIRHWLRSPVVSFHKKQQKKLCDVDEMKIYYAALERKT